ncbi:MAG: methyltransferase domain-containing protein [bacterium]
MLSLCCPRCDAQLVEHTDAGLSCPACKIDFPVLDPSAARIPFLWSEPHASLLDWQNRFNATLADLETQRSGTELIHSAAIATQHRLQHLNTALTRHQQELQTLFHGLQVGEAIARETHLALRTRLPSHHGTLSYAQNIHRDWCWGDAENRQVLTHLTDIISGIEKPSRMLVLGCGAGRLAFDLHRTLGVDETWAVDSNPMLCLLGQRMCNGDTLTLTEFPLAPISMEDSAVERTLSAPGPVEGIQFVCADATRLPFSAAQFDLVITPWLIDVIDTSLPDFLQTIYRAIAPDGYWLNHGSLAFAGNQPVNRMTQEEVAALTRTAGFEVKACADTWLPYLQSPASRHHRTELTHTLLAQRDSKQARKRMLRHQHLPEWLVSGRTPVPLSPGLQTQITTTRIHAFIMSLIDGRRSVLDMAQVLDEQRLMPADQATMAIRQFLTTMLEEARRYEGRSQS